MPRHRDVDERVERPGGGVQAGELPVGDSGDLVEEAADEQAVAREQLHRLDAAVGRRRLERRHRQPGVHVEQLDVVGAFVVDLGEVARHIDGVGGRAGHQLLYLAVDRRVEGLAHQARGRVEREQVLAGVRRTVHRVGDLREQAARDHRVADLDDLADLAVEHPRGLLRRHVPWHPVRRRRECRSDRRDERRFQGGEWKGQCQPCHRRDKPSCPHGSSPEVPLSGRPPRPHAAAPESI